MILVLDEPVVINLPGILWPKSAIRFFAFVTIDGETAPIYPANRMGAEHYCRET
jgi:hypothetical protein